MIIALHNEVVEALDYLLHVFFSHRDCCYTLLLEGETIYLTRTNSPTELVGAISRAVLSGMPDRVKKSAQ